MTTRSREGGDIVVEALAARGVKRMFSVSGGPINSVYYASTRHDVQICHVRHEAAAAFMADAVYRATGRPGVALVTLGPGVTNTVTALATAQRAGVPMLVIGGQASTHALGRGAGMEVNTLSVVKPVTKWAAQVPHTDRIGEFLDDAWRHMLAPTPGPVYLEIPSDVLAGQAEPAPAAPTPVTVSRGIATADVEDAHRVIQRAQRLLVLVGDDVFASDACRAATRFVDQSGALFGTLRLARGAVDEAHQHSLGPAYAPCNPVLRQALAEADVVVLLGHPWEFDLDFAAGLNADATVVQVHPDAAVLGRNGPAHQAIAATTADFLRALPAVDAASRDEKWAPRLAAEWRDYRRSLASDAQPAAPIHPVTLVEAIAAAAPANTIYVTSHGNADFWADAQLVLRESAHYLRAGQSGSLGAEIPYGVSAKLARPGDPVVVFVGDGGFGYHAMELESALRYNAPIVVVVADDQKWGAIALPQRRRYGVEVAMDLPRRDWAAFARSLGCHGEFVERADDVGPALGRALGAGKPAVLHVAIASVESPYMTYIS